jgi:presenilin-like A22 family membrane protease
MYLAAVFAVGMDFSAAILRALNQWWVIRLSGFVVNFGFSAAGGVAVQKETACAR